MRTDRYGLVLNGPDVLRLGTLATLREVELDLLALLEILYPSPTTLE